MEQWNRIQNDDVMMFRVVLSRRRGRQENAGNVRVRVFEHVGEDFRRGRGVEFDARRCVVGVVAHDDIVRGENDAINWKRKCLKIATLFSIPFPYTAQKPTDGIITGCRRLEEDYRRPDGRRYLRRALRRALSVVIIFFFFERVRPSPFWMHFPLAEMSSGHRRRGGRVE